MVKLEISAQLQAAGEAPRHPLRIVYFKPDPRKSGGAGLKIYGRIQKLQPLERQIIMENGTRILVDDVLEVSEQEA
jgi:hypothetical protein